MTREKRKILRRARRIFRKMARKQPKIRPLASGKKHDGLRTDFCFIDEWATMPTARPESGE